MKKIILVIVAHTDDEVLGMGGTIARHVKNGDIVYGLSMTDGVGSRNEEETTIKQLRLNASIKAAQKLGLVWIDHGNFPDNSMDRVSLLEIVRFIEDAKSKIKPQIVYTHSSADLNIDHQIVSRATLTAFRPQPNEVWTELRLFEVPSSTDYGHKSITGVFEPNLFIDICETWLKKFSALKEYDMEMRFKPHSRSYEGLENLAKYRGNQVGLCYAEAFEIVRKIER